MEKRHVVAIKLLINERREIAERARAAGLRPSTFIRRAALGARIEPGIPSVNQDAWRELAAAAANLNQLAHRLNAAYMVGEDILVLTARDNAAHVVRALQDFRAALLGAHLEGASQE
jgi:hypothetical protein